MSNRPESGTFEVLRSSVPEQKGPLNREGQTAVSDRVQELQRRLRELLAKWPNVFFKKPPHGEDCLIQEGRDGKPSDEERGVKLTAEARELLAQLREHDTAETREATQALQEQVQQMVTRHEQAKRITRGDARNANWSYGGVYRPEVD